MVNELSFRRWSEKEMRMEVMWCCHWQAHILWSIRVAIDGCSFEILDPNGYQNQLCRCWYLDTKREVGIRTMSHDVVCSTDWKWIYVWGNSIQMTMRGNYAGMYWFLDDFSDWGILVLGKYQSLLPSDGRDVLGADVSTKIGLWLRISRVISRLNVSCPDE